MKICYEFKIKKIAFINDGNQIVPVGEFEQDSRDGDTCKMTVKLFPGLPEKLVELIKTMPQVLNMREIKQPADPILVLPEATDAFMHKSPKGTIIT